MQVLVHFWAHIVAISVVAHGFLPIGCTYMGFMLSLSLSLSLSAGMMGAIQQPTPITTN